MIENTGTSKNVDFDRGAEMREMDSLSVESSTSTSSSEAACFVCFRDEFQKWG